MPRQQCLTPPAVEATFGPADRRRAKLLAAGLGTVVFAMAQQMDDAEAQLLFAGLPALGLPWFGNFGAFW